MNKNRLKHLTIGVKLTIITLSFWLIKEKIDSSNPLNSISAIWHEKTNHSYGLWIILILLMPFNWFLEVYKWKRLLVNKESISLREAFKSVFMGLGVSIFIGQHLGQLLGRSIIFKKNERLKSWNIIAANQLSQSFITGLFGFISLIYFSFKHPEFQIYLIGFISILTIAILTLIFIIKSPRLILFIQKKRNLYSNISWSIIKESLFWSFLRYTVFATQFFIILLIFDISLMPVEMFTSIAIIFLLKTLIPTFSALGDLGTREFSAIYIFDYYHMSATHIAVASFTLWIINLLLPSLLGLFIALKEIDFYKFKHHELDQLS